MDDRRYWREIKQDAVARQGRRPGIPATSAGVRLSDRVWERLRARARQAGVPVSQMAEALLRDALEIGPQC